MCWEFKPSCRIIILIKMSFSISTVNETVQSNDGQLIMKDEFEIKDGTLYPRAKVRISRFAMGTIAIHPLDVITVIGASQSFQAPFSSNPYFSVVHQTNDQILIQLKSRTRIRIRRRTAARAAEWLAYVVSAGKRWKYSTHGPFIEAQTEAQCAMHALNNIYGSKRFTLDFFRRVTNKNEWWSATDMRWMSRQKIESKHRRKTVLSFFRSGCSGQHHSRAEALCRRCKISWLYRQSR